METLKVELQSFSHVILNDNGLEDNSNFSVAFKELKVAMRGFYKDRVYVWPFHKLTQGTTKETDEIVSLIVQLEIETSRVTPNTHNHRHTPKFKSEDRYIIGVLAQVFSASFERINTMK